MSNFAADFKSNKYMKKMKMLFVSALMAVMASSCGTTSTVPITGRKQNILVSDE